MSPRAIMTPMPQMISFVISVAAQAPGVAAQERIGMHRANRAWRIPFLLQTPIHLMSTWTDV